jgi:hypothetical protein
MDRTTAFKRCFQFNLRRYNVFPDRRTPDGRPVTTYEDLLDYLQAKAPYIERGELNCEGRRVVLYYTGTSSK